MRKSLTSKILVLTLLTIVVGMGLVVTYFLRAQNRDLIQERADGVEQQVAVLYESIKNNMLVGTAPIARSLLADLKMVERIREIRLFRANGQEAFSDDSTIRAVNEMMGWEQFRLIEPVSPTETSPAPASGYDSGYDYGYDYGDPAPITAASTSPTMEPTMAPTQPATPTMVLVEQSEPFTTAVREQTRQIVMHTYEEERELIYYVPLENEEDCAKCHSPELSPDPDVRGVIRVSTSLSDLDHKIQQNTVISVIIWLVVVVLLTVLVILGMRRLVLVPLKHIGEVAGEIERGNLAVNVDINSEDEIGILGRQINQMVVGLRERLKLTKFVSQATLEEVVSNEALRLGGEKRTLTVLFSDIRGFTSFSERHDPQEVMTILNTYMQRQAGIILRAGGDVDQFVGDEILGVFSAATMAEDAIHAARDIVAAIEALNTAQQLDIHVGIGIHTGPMIAGNIGAQGDVERLQRTVIGDAVNTGARICSVAAPGEILISADTYALVKDKVEVDEPRTVNVKGKANPVTVYPVKKEP
jgi:class 3 adenylate cyclase